MEIANKYEVSILAGKKTWHKLFTNINFQLSQNTKYVPLRSKFDYSWCEFKLSMTEWTLDIQVSEARMQERSWHTLK